MLGKLFVHEWKDTWKPLTVLNVAVLVLTVIGMITIQNDIWSKANQNRFIAITMVMYILFYIVAVCALSMFTGVFFWYRFYKNLFTDQGYLMHTLPVTSHELVLSKGFVALIWQMVSLFVVMVSYACMAFSLVASEGNSLMDVFAELLSEIDLGPKGVYLVVSMILMSVTAMIMSVLLGYASVSLGQLTKKHRLGASVAIYMGIYFVIQTASSYATIPFTMMLEKITDEMDMCMIMGNLFMVCFVVTGLFATGFYCITNYIIKNKLNLE